MMKDNSIVKTLLLSDGSSVFYNLTRKQIKNMYLRIYPDGKISVSAPLNMSTNHIESFILSKQDFIAEKLAKSNTEESKKQPELCYQTGDIVVLFGEKAKLEILRSNVNSVKYDEGKIVILTRKPNDTVLIKKLVDSWIVSESRSFFEGALTEALKQFSQLYPHRPELKIRKMTSRWGSCHVNKNRITLNAHLIKAHPVCTKFVIFHELCHFIHPNHSKAFYKLLEVFCPNWKAVKKLLDESLIL